jgi:hypothetical protein
MWMRRVSVSKLAIEPTDPGLIRLGQPHLLTNAV